jgi:hypothetical protein
MKISNGESIHIGHYTSSKVALMHILPHMRLRLNSLENSNDPSEYIPPQFHNIRSVLGNGESFIDNTYDNYKLVNDIMRKSTKIICFSQDYKIEDNNNIRIGQCGYINRMWTQYGDAHKGICLEINREEFEDENSDVIANANSFKMEPVTYKVSKSFSLKVDLKDQTPESYFGSRKFIEDNYKEYIFTKDHSWCTEHEYRMAKLLCNGEEDEYLSIKKSLRRILVGLHFPEDGLKALKEIVNDETILIERIHFQFNSFSSRDAQPTY